MMDKVECECVVRHGGKEISSKVSNILDSIEKSINESYYSWSTCSHLVL